jgi:FSR family fosmidomycin resistance protein-like MFS transporter
MLLADSLGMLLLGSVADRVGLRRTLVVITQVLVGPLMLVFVYVWVVVGSLALMLVGACVAGTFGVTMLLSQLYLVRYVGVASGLAVGLALGVGGIAAGFSVPSRACSTPRPLRSVPSRALSASCSVYAGGGRPDGL